MEKQEKIHQAYIEHVLEMGRPPASVFTFMKKLKLKESDFYEYYNSFELLESKLWASFLTETRQKIESEEVYANYTVREKVLAFYYTLIEVLKENRSYVSYSFHPLLKERPPKPDPILREFKQLFSTFITDLLAEGMENKEVQERKYVSDKYPEIFWLQLLFVIDFWVKDKSQGFEKTDTLIEKAVNTSFDLMKASVVDSIVDFGKFLFQNRW